MSVAAEPFARPGAAALSLRYALRELRGGLRGFYVFIACIALGVMAISGVGSVAASLGDGMARSADGKLALVEMKAVDDTYPMLGELALTPAMPMSELLAA